MEFKIVADSSADLKSVDAVSFSSAPLKIITAEKEYIDDAEIDVEGMISELLHYKGKSSTACPGVGDWLEAFGNAERIFCLTISGTISGSFNSACMAKQDYEEKYPDRRVFVLNTLSAGPQITLLVEKAAELIQCGMDFEEICEALSQYHKNTHLLFTLESLKNFASNGRVNVAVAKAIGLLGIRLVGKASDQGTLEPLNKCRGEQGALKAIMKHLRELGYQGGRMSIAHCQNEPLALQLKAQVLAEFPTARIDIHKTHALCSYYAERGGMLIGFET